MYDIIADSAENAQKLSIELRMESDKALLVT